MVTSLDAVSRHDLLTTQIASLGSQIEKSEQVLARIERLGVHLFQVSNCIVSFGHAALRLGRSDTGIAVQEAQFCDQAGFYSECVQFSDLSIDQNFSKHPFVQAEPNLRFFAAHPVFDEDNAVVACIYLLDYKPQHLDDEANLLFADLARILERELMHSTIKLNQAELLKQVRNLKRDVLLDPVLGMWNRPAIIRALSLELERCSKAEKPLALLLLGFDQFDDLKNRFGSVALDSLLLRVVSRMRSCIRPFDALGRFGDDVFLVVLPGASHLVATAVAERIRLAIVSHPEVINDQSLDVVVRIGITASTVFPDALPDSLISYAEKALHSARTAGNTYIVLGASTQPEHPLISK
jgi:diguanylate cyclase (GGDEF)-like protein